MIEAKDVLLIVLAFCALWFTAFVCWLIYQVARILKNVNDTVSDVRDTLGKIEAVIAGVRDKFDHATSHLGLMAEGAGKLVSYVIDAKLKTKKKKVEKEEK